jgi:hypothetical protein
MAEENLSDRVGEVIARIRINLETGEIEDVPLDAPEVAKPERLHVMRRPTRQQQMIGDLLEQGMNGDRDAIAEASRLARDYERYGNLGFRDDRWPPYPED